MVQQIGSGLVVSSLEASDEIKDRKMSRKANPNISLIPKSLKI